MADVNADATRIWDGAETYVIPAADVPGGNIEDLIPATVDEPLDPLWEFVGLQDADAGVPITPELEIVHYDAFGHSRYRSKARKGSLTTGFTAFEDNSVTRKFVLPGSGPGRIGAPKGLRFYVLYKFDDEGYVDILGTTRPALFELSSHSGKTEGGQESYEIACHHANDANGDVFIRVESDTSGVPVVSSHSPATLVVAGGTLTTLTGSGFTGATAVAFGGTAATSFTVVSDTKIAAVAPAKSAGSVNVVVTTPAGPSAPHAVVYA